MWGFVSLLALPVSAQPQATLTVVSAGPEGEVATRDQSNEIRVVFSEPMVTLGRLPDVVSAPFFKVSPAIRGTFRWSGTTVLIFTPDPQQPLPFATTYEVTIDTTATAISGRTLQKPLSFRFNTPSVRLLNTHWYRRDGTVNSPLIVLLRFNQPVRPADAVQHVSAQLQRHAWEPPSYSAEETARLEASDPAALEQFHAKVAATKAVAAGSTRVALRLADDWNKTQFAPSSDLVVFETTTPVAPESWVQIRVGAAMPSPDGPARHGRVQEFTIKAEPAFFVDGFACRTACDADSRNPIELRAAVSAPKFEWALRVTDITAAPQPVVRSKTPRVGLTFYTEESPRLTLEDAGFDPQPPNRKYVASLPASLTSSDGQTLGYSWIGIVDNWHKRAFTSFGGGHGVWEKDGGSLLPFYARNMRDVTQWVFRVQPPDVMPTLLQMQATGFTLAPDGAGQQRRLAVKPDVTLSHGLDLSPALLNGAGVAWVAVRDGAPIARSRSYGHGSQPAVRSSLVQVTNLGVTVKDSPQNTLIFVTRLDTGAPVEGATVSIVKLDNSVHWRGVTGPDGLAVATDTPLRDVRRWYELAFVVIAEKDGDVAYTASNWNEGILPWDFGSSFTLSESLPALRGSVFTDRGVYRLGEQVQFKAILRHNTPTGVRLLPRNGAAAITVRDSQNRVVDQRKVNVNAWSSAEWTMTLPPDGALGSYSVHAELDGEKEQIESNVYASFLVAAYRRPDFRVDVSLTSPTTIAGDVLGGVVRARYLFGAAMGSRPVAWRYTKSQRYGAPSSITETFSDDRWIFVGYPEHDLADPIELQRADAELEATGDFEVELDTQRDAGVPYLYTLEGDVEDVSRQHIANRAALLVHPAPWYVGVRRSSYFLEQKNGLKTEIVAAGLDGRAVAGVPVRISLTRVQWQSARRAVGNGFYTWETERRDIPVGAWTVTTAAQPVPFAIPFETGGYFVLEVRGDTTDGRHAVTRTSFYVLGEGYTAWQRFDHNRIELVPEKQTYKPGDLARVMIQSPWEQATALVTTEREGIKSYRQFALTSTQQSITVPITESDIPNVFVSVLLIKGRTASAASSPPDTSGPNAAHPTEEEASDPGKPSFRMGYVELNVDDRSKRLTVSVTANQQEYRPATDARVMVNVKDQNGRGVTGEVTLWAVDYGVLSLTAYRTPDVLGSVYVRKALQVMNADNRQRIVSRRVLTPKGATDGGGGGGQDAGVGAMRKDFRVLAFWLGSVVTDSAGRASIDVKLPESLTTYRVMAVAADRNSRFGAGETEVRTNKPVTLKSTFPRFLAVGDSAFFGAVVGSQLANAGDALVTMKSLDPAVLEISGAEQRVSIAAGGAREVRFRAAGKRIGRARLQMTVRLNGETDAFEDVVPVEVLASPETVAAYGEVNDTNSSATESITVPPGVVPGFGGLQLQLSSTAMVGLGEGARYLVEYPYGCAEQKGSRALALLLAADLGDAFTLGDLDVPKMRASVRSTLKELERFQCYGGGFAYWPGNCDTVSPYLTAYLLHVFKVASDLKYDVDAEMREKAYEYLERELAQAPPVESSWWPAYTAWQAFAVKVLVEGGRTQDSNVTRLYEHRDRMPVFALAYLHDAMRAKGESGARVAELQRRMLNAILPEAGSAHVEELNDPYLLWFWNSNVRSTAIVLNSLIKADVTSAPVRPLVRWMMSARTDGRWGNTQENAHAMEALVAYYRKHEAVMPNFEAVVRLGQDELARERFAGRSTEASITDVPMTSILASGAPSATHALTFSREGAGTLFYTARLRYAADQLFQNGLDAGIQIARRYEPFDALDSKPPSTTYAAGDLVRVTLTFRLTKERRFVAVTDPLPAGFEAVESWFDTTAQALASRTRQTHADEISADVGSWTRWWRDGGFDHVERHDDRIQLFATRLAEGVHEFSYVVRATTAGTFRTAPARAEQMYEPEIFGRTATTIIEVKQQ